VKTYPATPEKVRYPIKVLSEKLTERGFTFDPRFLCYALGKGIIDPGWLLERTNSDEVFEFAETIRDDVQRLYRHHASEAE
jgi:hypothetical protein